MSEAYNIGFSYSLKEVEIRKAIEEMLASGGL
jgi:hypothetical protein